MADKTNKESGKLSMADRLAAAKKAQVEDAVETDDLDEFEEDVTEAAEKGAALDAAAEAETEADDAALDAAAEAEEGAAQDIEAEADDVEDTAAAAAAMVAERPEAPEVSVPAFTPPDRSRTTRQAALDAVANDEIAKKQRTLKYRLKRNKASYVMMGPYFLLFFLFTVLPVVMSIILSFTYFNMLEFPKFNGWDNYIKLFLNDDIFLISLKNTLIFAVVTGPISYLLCLLFAWIINEFRPKVRTFLTLIFYAPSICGNAYMVWSLILSSDRYGYLNGLLMNLGFINEQKLWMQDAKLILPCLIVVQLWLSLGTGFLSFIAGLQTVDKSLYEAAALDGVKNRWQELWYVTLPAMKPQLMFGAVMQITQSFAVADISIQLAGNPSVNYAGATVVTHLLDYGSTRFDMGYASAIATVLFLLMVGTNKLVQKLLRRVGE